MKTKDTKIGWWSVVITAGLIFIFFNLFGSSLLSALRNKFFPFFSFEYDPQYIIFGFTMGIITFILGILIGIQKEIKKLPTSFIAGMASFFLYIGALVPVRMLNLNTILLIFFSIVVPMILGTWLISLFKK